VSSGGASQPPHVTGVRSRTLRSRLISLFALAGVIVALVTALCVVSFVHLTDTRRALLTHIDPASLDADRVFEAYLDEETGIRGYLLTRDTAFLQPYFSGVSEQRLFSSRLRSSLTGSPVLVDKATAAQSAATEWFTDFAVPSVLATLAGKTSYAQEQLLGPGKVRFDLIRARFAALDAALATERVATGTTLTDATTQLIVALGVALALALLAGFLLAIALRSWVTRPLEALGDSVRRVTDGDLSHRIDPAGPPEIADLGQGVEAMRQRIVSELDDTAAARADLTERNLDLLRSNEELEQFAYVASHDLQEPLRKVTSFVQLLQQRYQGQLDDRADQYIEYVVDGSKRMQILINDLLTFSRVGRLTDEFVPVDMGAVVHDVVHELSPAIDESGAEVTIGPLPTVVGDPVLLTSLWQNLIGNSLKFRGEDAPLVTVGAERVADDWRFTVTDNGIGIEPRFAERVFVIFQRLHARDAYDGTGIGLAMCKKIVEYHGGTIEVDTGYLGGARLHFTLPADEEGSPAWSVRFPVAPSSS
jgi:signal transduction histidine kinase